MNVRKLILSGAVVALMGFVTTGCNENPIADPGDGPTGLKASSMSETSVALQWDAVAGATSYKVSWSGGAAGSGSVDNVTATTYTVTGLAANTQYTFSVAANDASGLGEASSITWAGATRFTETSTAGQMIRMYEAESTQPSGVNLNVNGAPRLVSLRATATDQAKAQLAMYIYPRTGGGTPDSVIIGPVYALTEYRISGGNIISRMDTSVYISGSTYQVSSLNTWYLSSNLESLIDQASNVKAYTFKQTNISGQGFIVRTGSPGAYNYARVVVKAIGGSILQGAFPNRYVELEVSYQTQANVPYAKPGMRPAPVGVYATAGH
jgi:hypothetical protein